MGTKEHRKPIPLGVKLHACLLLMGHTDEQIIASLKRRRPSLQSRIDNCLRVLGFGDEPVDWDHSPALVFREIVNGVMTPAPNDPHFIRPMRRTAHKEKTSGRKGITVAGSDQHMAGKIRRITGVTKKKPSRKIQSRGFPKRK